MTANEQSLSTPEKRTWCYLLPPKAFEMPPCSCGNHETQWSEFAKHLWCSKCEKDFIPEHAGIFSGPIAIKLMKAFGITFDRIIIATGVIERLDVDKLQYIPDAPPIAAARKDQEASRELDVGTPKSL